MRSYWNKFWENGPWCNNGHKAASRLQLRIVSCSSPVVHMNLNDTCCMTLSIAMLIQREVCFIPLKHSVLWVLFACRAQFYNKCLSHSGHPGTLPPKPATFSPLILTELINTVQWGFGNGGNDRVSESMFLNSFLSDFGVLFTSSTVSHPHKRLTKGITWNDMQCHIAYQRTPNRMSLISHSDGRAMTLLTLPQTCVNLSVNFNVYMWM